MMQQKTDRRRPSALIYRPPVGRIRNFRDNSQGVQSTSFRPDDLNFDSSRSSKPIPRYNPYAPKLHNLNNRKYFKPRVDNIGERNHRGFQPLPFNGYRITVPQGKEFGKIFIYKTISSSCKGVFIPYNFKLVEDKAIFYMTDHSIAREIREMNRKFTTPDGREMVVHIFKCQIPFPKFDPETMEMIKNIVSARYDTLSHSLNLSQFINDENMKSLGLRLPLNNTTVFTTISNIIKENIPELENLDLSDNNLCFVSKALTIITSSCQQLKCLNLRNNKLKSFVEFDCMKALKIIEIVLAGNPICDSYTIQNEYIGAVRKQFPNLATLDGMLLPEIIGFDLGTESLPISKKSFFPADNAKDVVLQFLDQYYTIFDSGDRTKLLEAYHDQAYFSLCLAKHTPKNARGGFGNYQSDNRNLLTVNDSQRFKLLRHGKLSIVTVLSELPQTVHDPTSFNIDIFHVSSSLMSFSVVGVFKEVKCEHTTTKTFSRTYVVAPQGQGFVITNETLFIGHPSKDQQSKAFVFPAPTPSPSPAPSPEGKNDNEKHLMVAELSKQTGMNIDFSTKCLEENDWNYQRAVEVFMKFQLEGKLPPEAFISHPSAVLL